jgi:hypothetical protein
MSARFTSGASASDSVFLKDGVGVFDIPPCLGSATILWHPPAQDKHYRASGVLLKKKTMLIGTIKPSH